MEHDPRFERAFVAMSYLLGARSEETLAVSSPEARALVSALASAGRPARAAMLAQEMARIAAVLEQGALALTCGQKAGERR